MPRPKPSADAQRGTKRKGRDQSSPSDSSGHAHGDSDANDSDDGVIEVSPPKRQAKKKKFATKAAKPSSKRDLSTDDEDSSDSDAAVIVRRPSMARERHKQAIKAKKGKVRKNDINMTDSSTDSSSVPASKRLSKAKGVVYLEGKKRAKRRLTRAMDRSVLRREQEFNGGTPKEFKHLIPKPQYDDFWTIEDQENLERWTESDQDFQKRCEIREPLVGVWKTAYRFLGCLATDIVGPSSGLVFRSDTQKGKGGQPMWTATFCEVLTAIILHPLFSGSTEKMSLAIQWAVICRTDDRRKYKIRGCEDDLFIRELKSVIDEHQHGTRTARDLRELACYKYMGAHKNVIEPPVWSQFLGHIERKASRYAQGRRDEDDVVGPQDVQYFVNISDVRAVKGALDRMEYLGMRMFVDSRAATDAVKPSKDLHDIPNTELTRMAIKAVLLQEQRNKKRLERGGAQETSPDHRPKREPPS